MNRSFLRHSFVPVLVAFVASAHAQQPTPPPGGEARGPGAPPRANRFGVAQNVERRPRYARTRNFDQQHIKLDVRFDRANKKLIGEAALTFAPFADNQRELVLDATDMKINQVTRNGAALKFRHEGEQLYLELAPPARAGQSFVVTIAYETVKSARAPGGFGGANGIRFVQTDPEDQTRTAQVWTQGEPETNHFWFPCYDYPNDKATSEVIVHTPANWLVISNGRLAGVTNEKGGGKVWHWTQEQPHSSYLVSLAAGELEQAMDSWEGVPLHYVGAKGSGTAKLRNAFDRTKEMLTYFSKVTGVKYPWAKYAQCAMAEFGGGMENTSATTVGAGVLHDDRAHLDLDNESLVSHELAHQWFGDLVTCKDWSHLWLNEGFATFMASLWAKQGKGEDEYRMSLNGEAQSSVFADNSQKRPIVYNVYGDPLGLLGTFAYPKPAFVLHMLKQELGEEAFWRGINAYLKRYAHKNADTHDFRRALEEATGRDLEEWFQQWFYSPGHPDFKVRWDWNDERKIAHLTVEQTQKLENGVPIFKVPVVIGFLVNGAFKDLNVFCDSAQQEFSVQLDAKPALVLFDKQRDVMKTLDLPRTTDEEIARLLYAPGAPDRLEAAQKLASQTKEARVVDTLRQSFRQEKYHRIRGEVARALAQLGTTETVDPLMNVLNTDRHQLATPADRFGTRIRREVIQALSSVKNRADVQATLRRLADSDDSYFCRSAAISALAQIDPKAPGNWEVFVRATQQDSQNDVVRSTAFSALAVADADRALAIVLQFLDKSKAMEVRVSAVNALMRIGRGKTEARDALVALLESKSPRLKRTVLQALNFRGDKEAAGAVQALIAKESDEQLKQYAQIVHRGLNGPTPPPPTVAELQQEIQRLRADNDRLQKELADVKAKLADGK